MFIDRRNFLLLGDSFDLAFANFHDGAKRFKKNWNERIHTVKDEQISARVLNHWLKNGLIEDERTDGKGWHRFSSSDVFWIRCIIKLRKFGVSIDDLLQVKRQLEIGTDEASKRPVLEYYIAYTFFEKKPARLLVFPGGEALIGSQEQIEFALQHGSIQDDFISIDVNRMLGKLGADVNYLRESKSEVERAISNALDTPEIKEVTIKSKETKYVLKSTQIMENRTAALAAKQLHDFCILEESVRNGKSKFQLTASKHIKKQ